MIKDIFIAVEKAITENAPGIRYVAEDWGQLDFYQSHPPVQWPCLLYDVSAFDYSDRGLNSQDAVGTITVRVADYNAVNTSTLAPDHTPPLTILGVISDAYKALQGLDGETFTGLRRTKLTRVRRDDGIREYEMTFKTSFTDNDATRNYTKARPTAQIGFNINRTPRP
jgi:hypothetical protein